VLIVMKSYEVTIKPALVEKLYFKV